jgi:hypothetical protein
MDVKNGGGVKELEKEKSRKNSKRLLNELIIIEKLVWKSRWLVTQIILLN